MPPPAPTRARSLWTKPAVGLAGGPRASEGSLPMPVIPLTETAPWPRPVWPARLLLGLSNINGTSLDIVPEASCETLCPLRLPAWAELLLLVSMNATRPNKRNGGRERLRLPVVAHYLRLPLALDLEPEHTTAAHLAVAPWLNTAKGTFLRTNLAGTATCHPALKSPEGVVDGQAVPQEP